MAKPKNAMEIFQHLDKSNCRECGEKTCLAFAGAVFKGEKSLDRCPKLDAQTIEALSGGEEAANPAEQTREEYLRKLKEEVTQTDLSEAADRVGGRFNGKKLTVKVLGKDFNVDTKGVLSAEIHVNPWVAVPFLNYVIYAEGVSPTGNWVSFRELKNGPERYPLFQKRCEEAMKQVADVYTDLFDDMVHLFGGKQVDEAFESDIAVVLHPLPKVPIMICYWEPEEDLASALNLFYDETADRNLDIGSLFTLGAGLTQMFEKLAARHGYVPAAE
jgi:hypothetical protein